MSKFAPTVAFIGVLLCALAPSFAAGAPNNDLLGFVSDVGSARDVVISPSTGLAYVASGQFGLAIVDISNPSNPVAIGGANPSFYAEHVAVSGTVAALISGPLGLRVVDITVPQAPLTKGSLDGTFRAVAMSGRYAYLAETVPGNPATSSLDVVDVGDPGNPTIVGRLNLGAVGIGGVKAIGSRVYVAAGSAGLKVIDASTPASPRIIGSVTPAGGANALAVAGHYAYVATSLTIAVIDVNSPTSPSIVGSVFALGTTLAASGGRLYALNGSQYNIIDVSVATSPRLLGSAGDFSAQGLDASANLLFLATPQVNLASQTGGLYVIDTTQPQSPTVLANVFNGYDAFGVGVDGDVAVVSAGSLGMRIVDVSTPAAPVVVGGISGTVRAVAVAGQYAYFTQIIPGNPSTVTFDVLSIANQANPSVVGALNLGSIGVGAIKAVGSLVYLAGGSSGLNIIDASNPQSPRVIGSASPVGGVNTLTISGHYAYVGTPTSMVVVDVAISSGPNILGSVTTTPSALAAASGRVYSISGNQLVTIDVSDPRAPRILNSIGNFGAQGVAAIGTTVFLARPAADHSDPNGGVFVLDASDPTQEQVIERIIVPGTTRAVVVERGLVYAGDSASTIDVINVPVQVVSTPSPAQTATPPSPARTATPTAASTPSSTSTRTNTATLTPTDGRTPTSTASSLTDRDSDGVPDAVDNCPTTWNPAQSDANGLHIGDICDASSAGTPFVLRQVYLKAAAGIAGAGHGTVIAKGELDISEWGGPSGFAELLSHGFAVHVDGAGLVVPGETTTFASCASLSCKGSGPAVVTFKPKKRTIPNLLTLRVTMKGRTFAPPLGSAQVAVTLSFVGRDRRDQIDVCKLGRLSRTANCRAPAR